MVMESLRPAKCRHGKKLSTHGFCGQRQRMLWMRAPCPPPIAMRVGAIDVGSNSVRMLVAEVPASGALSTVARAGEACRLGRGLDRTGVVDPEMATRAAVLVADFARRARELGAARLVICATAALRQASNGRAVAEAIAARAGEAVRILSGDEEARLVYQSVLHGLGRPASRTPCVVFDLGGGSTEVVSGLGLTPGRWTSLPCGAVSLTEQFLTSSPPASAEVAALEQHVDELLQRHCAFMPPSTPLLAGVGGTVTVLAALHRGITSYDPALLEGALVELPRLEELVERVVRSTEEERESWAVMGQGRSDIVVAGALVVRRLARRFPSRGLVCSTQGLRYGLARMAAAGALRPGGDARPLPG
jgi:exopolyphosphatase / guanosine-5'-triphosphate,3'-diphosphate pyrophosphatase